VLAVMPPAEAGLAALRRVLHVTHVLHPGGWSWAMAAQPPGPAWSRAGLAHPPPGQGDAVPVWILEGSGAHEARHLSRLR